jgi:EAL domain-containing protein (putative c-di-GMP-specific phosphodiesterase class I)
LAHIIRQDDGTSTGVWGGYVLKSAFQPIFAFREGRLEAAAYEGLARPFKDGEALSPGNFFRIIHPVDRLHVETLARTLHLLNAGACLDPKASIFVNFDPSLFCEASVAETALREMRLVLHEARIDPDRIVCEVTEQNAPSAAGLQAFVAALRRHAFRVAVDDYGAESSDMGRIKELRPDIVKFDAQWTTRLMESGPGFALLKVMVEEFAARGIATVFEGIEEGWQLELAERSGARMVQGYALARPEIAPTSFGVFSRAARAAAVEPDAAAASARALPAPEQRGLIRAQRVPFGRRAAS